MKKYILKGAINLALVFTILGSVIQAPLQAETGLNSEEATTSNENEGIEEKIAELYSEELAEEDTVESELIQREHNTMLFSTPVFNINDWVVDTSNPNSYVLTSYVGTEKSILIPGQYNGKSVFIQNIAGDGLNKDLKSQGVTTLVFQEVNNVKVKVLDTRGEKAFANLPDLQELDLSGLDTSTIQTMNYMFEQSKVRQLDVSSLDTSNATNMIGMFSYAETESLDLTNFNTLNVTSTSRMFFSMKNIKTLGLGNFNTSNVSDMSWMFGSMSALENLNLGNDFDTSKVGNMSWMFGSMVGQGAQLKTLDLGSKFDTSKVGNMDFMFSSLSEMETLIFDVDKFDTANVRSMMATFGSLHSLKSLDVSKFNTSKVKDMTGTFYDAYSLEILDVSNFDTSNVTGMSFLFRGLKLVEELDVSNFDTTNVNVMYEMFSGMTTIRDLDVSNFDTSNVTSIYRIFAQTPNLEMIDMSSFDLSSIISMNTMTDMFLYSELDANSNPLKIERLVIATDPKLLAYDYEQDNNIPLVTYATFDANGGKFSDDGTIRTYGFQNVVEGDWAAIFQSYNDFAANAAPKKNNQTFSGWNKELPTTPKSFIAARKTTYLAQWGKDSYTITANNFTMTFAELENMLDSEALDEYLIEKADAKVYNTTQNIEVLPITVNTTALKTQELYDQVNVPIEFSYSIPTKRSTVVVAESDSTEERNERVTEGTTGEITAKINVTIVDEKAIVPGLPVTGRQVAEAMLIAILMLVLGFVALVLKSRYQTREN